MTTTRLGRLVCLLFGCALLVGALLMMRAKQIETRKMGPRSVPNDAGDIYRQRLEKTDELLKPNGQEVSWVR
jgi:hypothetical protein